MNLYIKKMALVILTGFTFLSTNVNVFAMKREFVNPADIADISEDKELVDLSSDVELKKRKSSPVVKETLATIQLKSEIYGNKYANLLRLVYIVKETDLTAKLNSLGGYSVEVPFFTGLSDDQGQQFVHAQGLNVAHRWRSVSPATSAVTHEELVARSAQMSGDISRLNTPDPERRSATPGDALFCVSPLGDVSNVAAIPMLKHLSFKKMAEISGQKLMVRSSGKEDSDSVSNAGGNESYANVVPSWDAIGDATNKVIASYFSRKSIQQRILQEDSSVRDRPISPVLFQCMIGEREGGALSIDEIPVGCVVYTQEPYANTPGVTIIQSSWGHNTGVVESTVAVDSYFIDSQNNINSLIKIKLDRWVPVSKNGQCALVKMENPKEIQLHSSLDEASVFAIKVVSDQIAKVYGVPMDIELVYMPHEKKIYLVQARPLKLTSVFRPSYLKNLNGIGPECVISGMAVLPADCRMRLLTDKKHLIVARTLNDALEAFNCQSVDRAAVKSIIVCDNSEATSHAAAIFRSVNMPVLVVQDIEKIRKWLDAGDFSLIVDIQRGLIVNKTVDQLLPESGWFTHPMPKKISIPDINQKNQHYSIAQEDAFMDINPDKSMQELIAMLKESDESTAQNALDSILSRIQKDIMQVRLDKGDQLKSFIAETVSEQIERLYLYAVHCSNKIRLVLSKPALDIERLYVIQFLENILFQQKDTAYVNVYSLYSLMSDYKIKINFIEKILCPNVGVENARLILQSHELFDIAVNGFDCSLTKEIENLWIKFIVAIANFNNKALRQDFIEFINAMGAFNSLHTWINAVFAATWSVGVPVDKYIQGFLGDIAKSHEFLDLLYKLSEKIKYFDLKLWEDPNLFKTQLKLFLDEIVNPLKIVQFQMSFDNSKTTVKLIALSLMYSLVELFDQSIKRLKGSVKYKNGTEKVENFKIMLLHYFALLKSWVPFLTKESLKCHPDWPMQKYLQQIQDILIKLDNDERQLFPGLGFSVANASLGSTTDFERNLPERGEDVFTLIHQNLLVFIGAVLKKTLPDSLSKPDLFKKTENGLLSLSYKNQDGNINNAWLIGVRFEKNAIVARYNLPLNYHSLVLELAFDKLTNETYVTLRFVGIGLYRWTCIQQLAELQGLLGLGIKHSCIGENEVAITFRVTSDKDIEMLLLTCNDMIHIADQTITVVGGTLLEHLKSLNKNKLVSWILESDNNWKLFESLYKTRISEAKQRMAPYGQALYLEVFHTLVLMGYAPAYNIASTAAWSVVNTKNDFIESQALSIFTELVKRSYTSVYDFAFQALERVQQTSNTFIERMGLLAALIETSNSLSYNFAIDTIINEAPYNRASSSFEKLIEVIKANSRCMKIISDRIVSLDVSDDDKLLLRGLFNLD